MSTLREALAELEHDRWSRWQRYLHDQCNEVGDGCYEIPAQSVQHWERQISTPYTELSEREKDSDRKEADATLAVLARFACAECGGLRDTSLPFARCGCPVHKEAEGTE